MSQEMLNCLEPVFDNNCRILILGSIPSPKSFEYGFYYGHPQNRFWPVITSLIGCSDPMSIEGRRQMLLKHGIALWDVIASCRRPGALDANITDVSVNDIVYLCEKAENLQAIALNGSKAKELYIKKIGKIEGMDVLPLPSTSPANAVWTKEKLINEWGKIKKYIY